ncbi:uncharacterized protein C7444_10166 [Sphaerotilus hippei]|uniref:YecA family protein n=1 Tax=Sphaerotilus hippei TaxID=744406 RepID=A0A318H5K4_9BURK|nr:YecA family protein [Sphaerotilus hippei]PXW99237.1 uncharacterized protein C7444_10166 [Sphaerotilus hippei]
MNYAQHNPALPLDPLTDDDLNKLEQILNGVPTESAMDLECLDGYLTGLLVSPRLPPTEAWIPLIWGGDTPEGPPFVSGKAHKRCVLLIMRLLAELDARLRHDVEAIEPMFGAAWVDDEELVDGELWCIGFLHGLSACAEQWDGHLDDAAVALALRPISLMGSDELGAEDAALIETPRQRDEWSRQVPESVVTLYRHWRP